ncbi:hypothetical protein [Pelobacter seleniigenes]|uniref:hypothetical protein n=1 Tax=Pelobacter seleniigenes TaxID=407188 RepID=UPI0012B7505F|nr:hypothetical protein [Pelobacter seleniigenes]
MVFETVLIRKYDECSRFSGIGSTGIVIYGISINVGRMFFVGVDFLLVGLKFYLE